MDRISHIRDKIELVGLDLNPPVSEKNVALFELESGILLPMDYRNFITNIADGGKGDCRLCSLDEWASSYWIEQPNLKTDLKKDCLIDHTNAQNEANWLDALGIKDWSNKWDSGIWDPMCGSMAICEYGCGLFFSQILTGPNHGQIFLWGDHALNPPYIQQQQNYLDWLEFYLDGILQGDKLSFLKSVD